MLALQTRRPRSQLWVRCRIGFLWPLQMCTRVREKEGEVKGGLPLSKQNSVKKGPEGVMSLGSPWNANVVLRWDGGLSVWGLQCLDLIVTGRAF